MNRDDTSNKEHYGASVDRPVYSIGNHDRPLPGYSLLRIRCGIHRADLWVPHALASKLVEDSLKATETTEATKTKELGSSQKHKGDEQANAAEGKDPSHEPPKHRDHIPTVLLYKLDQEPHGSVPACPLIAEDSLVDRVRQHNAGQATSDLEVRRFEATLLRETIEKGLWRKCGIAEPHDAIIGQLQDEFAHMPELVELVERELIFAKDGKKVFELPPILFVGDPGVGKTHCAIRVAELCGLPARVIDMPSQQTNSLFAGSDRHWTNSRPGLLFELLVFGECINPVIILDEIDKIGEKGRHDPISPLHGLLEKRTAQKMRDLSINIEFDASKVIYMATANSLKGIPISLLSRFEIIVCRQPGPREMFAVAQNIARQVIAELGQQRNFAPASREVIRDLANRNPREAQRMMRAAVKRAVQAGRKEVRLQDLHVKSHAEERPPH